MIESAPLAEIERYKINLFGPVSVYRPDGSHLPINNQKHAWLIVYLATRPGHVVDRQSVAGLLWPSTTDKRAQESLRTSLRNFRRALGSDAERLFQSTNSQLMLNSDRIEIDVDVVQALVASCTSAAVAEAIDLVQSEIAEGLVVKEPETAEWLDKARSLIRQRLLNLVERKLREFPTDDTADPLIVRYLSELCLRIEPTFEYAHFQLIQYYHATQQTPLALKHYRRYREMLAEELDAAPGPELEELVSRIRYGTSAGAAVPEQPGKPPIVIDELEKPRISLHSRSIESDSSDLMALDKRLSVALSKFRTFDVSANADADESHLIQLHSTPPRYRVDYEINKRGTSRTVTLILIDKLSNTVLWADTFVYPDRADEEAYDDLMAEISNVIDAELRRANLTFKPNARTVYDLWLDADSLAESFQPDADLRAEKILVRLVEKNVEFSRIYSSLASVLLKKRLFDPSAVKDRTLLDTAKSYAHNAIRLDPRDAVNYQTLGWVYYQQGNAKQGKELFEKAYRFNSVSSIVGIACAEAFAYVGETDRALALTEKVFRSPSTPPYYYGYLATICFARGDYRTCIDMCDLGPPSSLELMVLRAAAHACCGQTALATQTISRLVDLAFMGTGQQSTLSRGDIGLWLRDINMFFEPKTRHTFFSGLRSGGLEIPPDEGPRLSS